MLNGGIDDAHGKANICYALAKELEDIGESERSFFYLQRGAEKPDAITCSTTSVGTFETICKRSGTHSLLNCLREPA